MYNRDPDQNRQTSALRYDGSRAPKMMASGSGSLAAAIERLATEHNIPVLQDRSLSELLSRVPLGDEIPPSLYAAVATVLAYVFALEESAPEQLLALVDNAAETESVISALTTDPSAEA